MALFFPVTNDPIALTDFGLFGESVDNPDINGVAVSTFGFLYATGTWSECFDGVSTSWSACGTGASTGWTFCSIFD